jgi:PilZ domain
MLERLSSQWKKRGNRNPSSVTGAAYRADGSWVRVHISNMSYDGCLILSGDPFDIGEALTLVMPKANHLRGQVRWSEGLRHGLRFCVTSTVDERRARIGV